jgi:hypothetical protein
VTAIAAEASSSHANIDLPKGADDSTLKLALQTNVPGMVPTPVIDSQSLPTIPTGLDHIPGIIQARGHRLLAKDSGHAAPRRCTGDGRMRIGQGRHNQEIQRLFAQ